MSAVECGRRRREQPRARRRSRSAHAWALAVRRCGRAGPPNLPRHIRRARAGGRTQRRRARSTGGWVALRSRRRGRARGADRAGAAAARCSRSSSQPGGRVVLIVPIRRRARAAPAVEVAVRVADRRRARRESRRRSSACRSRTPRRGRVGVSRRGRRAQSRGPCAGMTTCAGARRLRPRRPRLHGRRATAARRGRSSRPAARPAGTLLQARRTADCRVSAPTPPRRRY